MAIVTNRLKKQVIKSLQADFNLASEDYYAVIGRSEDWNDSDVAPTPLNSAREERNFRLGLQSAKKIIDISFVVPLLSKRQTMDCDVVFDSTVVDYDVPSYQSENIWTLFMSRIQQS